MAQGRHADVPRILPPAPATAQTWARRVGLCSYSLDVCRLLFLDAIMPGRYYDPHFPNEGEPRLAKEFEIVQMQSKDGSRCV